jgi:hypothetical protein
MKAVTQKQIVKEIDELQESIKNDWSKWGDISDWTREWAIKKLKKIKRMMKAPQIVDFKLRRKLK